MGSRQGETCLYDDALRLSNNDKTSADLEETLRKEDFWAKASFGGISIWRHHHHFQLLAMPPTYVRSQRSIPKSLIYTNGSGSVVSPNKMGLALLEVADMSHHETDQLLN